MDFEKKVDQLSRNKTVLVELIKGISQEQSVWKPDHDRWSVLEALNHVIDIEIEDFRYIFNIILNNPEKKWPSFDEIEWITSREYNNREIKQTLQNFIIERDKSITWLKKMGNPNLDAIHSGNGFKGKRMKAGDVLVSWIAHDLFHIRQLTLLKWDILNEWSKPFSPAYSGFFI
jgi:hypothetical protein